MIVSGGQQRDSAICIHVSILIHTPLPPRVPHNTEQRSLLYCKNTEFLYSRSLLVVHLKYSSVYMPIPNSLTIPSPHPSCWHFLIDQFELLTALSGRWGCSISLCLPSTPPAQWSLSHEDFSYASVDTVQNQLKCIIFWFLKDNKLLLFFISILSSTPIFPICFHIWVTYQEFFYKL